MKCQRSIFSYQKLFIITAVFILCLSLNANASDQSPLIEVRKIWDAGKHNAFTDLIRWHDAWWCVFREADGHVGGDGSIRIINSVDGREWQSAALVSEKDIDLRDPKFSVTPDDSLMVVCGGSVYLGTAKIKGRQPRVMFSKNGSIWSEPRKVLGEWDWLWRVTWSNGKAYGVSYNTSSDKQQKWVLDLCCSSDGLQWDLISKLEVTGRPNETTLRFLENGDLMAMVRREADNQKGWIGIAKPPYKEWKWMENSYQFGGPNFIQLPDGSFVAGTRDYTGKPKCTTLIAKMTPETLQPVVTLPSGGDTSYPGLVWRDGILWVSYYSSHEGKTSIYLAKIKMPVGNVR
ncbi:MAG: hypothetical protein A2283_04205 [Lentisphaerae bacterium RIFOXYA12_FULL_48_11]|nr:MAG: hypothetical protein A2283_04205 [Lentisphaerae bacterium RIFOXYA12_FULL_48_11]